MMAFASTVEAAQRLELGTHRLVDRGGHLEAIPDFTKSMAADLDFLDTPAERPEPSDFAPFLQQGTPAWDQFFESRKVVRREFEDGVPVVSVTSNVADRLARDVPARREPGVKNFEVAQLLTDIGLMDKFQIKGSFRADLKNMAVVDTQRAAELLQKRVRQYEGYEKAVVAVGKYAYSWKAARERLKLQAARFPPVSVATSAMFIGDKIFIYGDAELGEAGWRVFGPERVASLVRMVHRMVEATSCESVAFAMGPELTILDIDIHDGENVLSPSRERHAGLHDDLPLSTPNTLMAALSQSSRQGLDVLARAVETVAVDGEDVASAVRVTSRYVLVNSHVAEEKGITCNGNPAFPQRMLSKDLWLTRCDGPEVAWHLREPEEGEEVVLCYRRHQDVQMSDPVKILSVGADVLAIEKSEWMRPGVSGAAVIALSDFSLVGLYDGVSLRRALVAAFTPGMYTEVCTLSEAGSENHLASSEQAMTVYSGLKSRGLGKVLDVAMASVTPLYTGSVHVGMGFSAGDTLYTVCDPDVAPLARGGGGQPLVFSRGPGPYFKAEVPGLSAAAPAVVRRPVYGESVFVVGKDDEGDYYSNSKARVVHVGVEASFFQISPLQLEGALPLTGGLVVAYSDAAVLGSFAGVRHLAGRGEVGMCYSVPDLKPVSREAEKIEVVLQRMFPMLRTGAWTPGVAQAVVTHASCQENTVGPGMAALAMVGDSAMRTLLWVRLMEDNIPTAKWQTFAQRDQCNSAQVKACERVGLAKLLRVGRGANVPAGSKVYADMLEALAGAVYLNETAGVFEEFCETVGLVGMRYLDIS